MVNSRRTRKRIKCHVQVCHALLPGTISLCSSDVCRRLHKHFACRTKTSWSYSWLCSSARCRPCAAWRARPSIRRRPSKTWGAWPRSAGPRRLPSHHRATWCCSFCRSSTSRSSRSWLQGATRSTRTCRYILVHTVLPVSPTLSYPYLKYHLTACIERLQTVSS